MRSWRPIYTYEAAASALQPLAEKLEACEMRDEENEPDYAIFQIMEDVSVDASTSNDVTRR